MKKYSTPVALFLLLSCFSAGRCFAAPMGAGFYDTSEYMIGKVAVAIVFPESNGSLQAQTENWSDPRKLDVESRIQAAMSWWAARNPAANLSFVYVATTVATGYEPINCNAVATSLPSTPPCKNGEKDWIMDVMGRMNYTESDYFDRVYHYDNDIRDVNGADWAFTIFVVDSLNDADGMFPDSYFAYAYLGGPFAVTTYDNDGYGIDYYSAIIAHETGHIFYAQDEYADSKCSHTTPSGYLNIPNENCENSGSSNVNCIMRGDIMPYYPYSTDCPTCNGPAVCGYTKNMLGWRDSNSNGIPDISDLPPTTVLYAYSPDPTGNSTPAYYGMAYSTTAYTNSNPYTDSDPVRIPNNISVNLIAGVEYRVDSGAWQAAVPRAGTFGHTIDSFTFTTAALADGSHALQARARDNFLAYDATPGADSLTIDTSHPPDIGYVYDGLGADINYVSSLHAMSANWGASDYSDVTYEYAIGTIPKGTDVTQGWVSAGPDRSVTRSGLDLVDGTLYYFAVRAVGVVGGVPVYSGVSVSDGQRVDVTSPTVKVEISSPLPAKTGPLNLKLVVTETNGLTGSPSLTFTPVSGPAQTVNLTYLVSSTWTGSAFIESFYSTGTAVFAFRAVDLAGNIGSVITAGGTFTVDTAVSGITGGTVVNSDNAAVAVPAGAYGGSLVIRISTVPSSRTALADSHSPDSVPLPVHDLTREFTAETPAGLAVTYFDPPLTIKLCYPDSNNDGLIDGDGIADDIAGLYLLDDAASRWTPVPGAVRNTVENCISAQTSHFSVYAIRATDLSQLGMDKLKAYPNPCYFLRSSLTIKGIPPDAGEPKVYIYNTAGELVRELERDDGIDSLNKAVWDGKNKSGQKAASGLYIYLAKTSNYGNGSGKFYIFW